MGASSDAVGAVNSGVSRDQPEARHRDLRRDTLRECSPSRYVGKFLRSAIWRSCDDAGVGAKLRRRFPGSDSGAELLGELLEDELGDRCRCAVVGVHDQVVGSELMEFSR